VLEQQDLAIRVHDASHLPQPGNRIGDGTEHACRRHGVERIVAVFQMLDVTQFHRDVACTGTG
jgi:hypothetical protein